MCQGRGSSTWELEGAAPRDLKRRIVDLKSAPCLMGVHDLKAARCLKGVNRLTGGLLGLRRHAALRVSIDSQAAFGLKAARCLKRVRRLTGGLRA